MSSLVSADISAACSALGYYDEKSNKYYADSNTLETVKDLIRYLRRDDNSHDIRRQLGESKVLQTDLLPLLKSYWEETDLFDVLLRLIVNLTTPALVLWNEELPTEVADRNRYLQIEGHLQNYKEAFADEGLWAVLSTRLSKILEIDYAERGDENSLIIERILILIRNIVYIPADSAEKRPDNDASVHDQVLWALHQSGMLDIILYITSSPHEQAYYMHLAEILCFMLREQKASELATAALQRSQIEKIRDEAELLSIRNRESNDKQKKVKKYTGARHSRFGGTFVVKSMKSISDNELIYHKPLSRLDELNFDQDKQKPRTPKNRLPVTSSGSDRRSAFSVRLFLKEFCVEFLNGAYNTFMYHVKSNLVRAKSQAHDESYYLWAIRFFMEFNRCYKFEVKLVSETMSVQTFHYVQQQSENYFDLIQTDKKKLKLWSRRLHLALLAYRELFLTLMMMDKTTDETVRESAKVIKSNIFYVLEYREFVLTLLITYDELKMSDAYLRDLIETQHIFLKMLESFCGKDGAVIVQQKSKKRRKANKKANPSVPSQPKELNLEAMWDEYAPQISAVLGSGSDFASDVVPFDAASEVPIDDQKVAAMGSIQRGLRGGEFEKSIGLLRAAREVWPENDSFGSHNMAPEEEFLALREIFFADLGENVVNPNEPGPTVSETIPDAETDDEEEEDEGGLRYTESDFKFQDFVKRLAHPKVVRACGLALRNFDKNPINTNHCIVKLLHRIAFDCKMYVMVFQVSLFRSFQRIYALKELPQYKELVKFATYIVRQFVRIAETNRKVFMEALFWKSSKEAYDIEHGYGCSDQTSTAARAWSEQEEDELRRLFMEHKHNSVEEDVVDWITANLIDHTKTRRQVLKKLKEMSLLLDYKGKKKSVSSNAAQNWSEEEETQLQELYEEFKDAIDPLGCIMPRLEVQRPKNRIIEKMLVMGLVQDRKELRKKRTKSSKKSGAGSRGRAQSESDGSSSSDEGDDRRSTPAGAVNGTRPKAKAKSTAKAQKKKKNKVKIASTSEVAKMIVSLVESGKNEALGWLKESFSDALEDLDDGSDEGIPLVPIMDYAMSAMEDTTFQKLLKGMGICEPFDEQEAYWRIPAGLNAETFRNYCDLIDRGLNKTLTVSDENESHDLVPQDTGADSSDDDIFDKLKKMTKSKSPEKEPTDLRENGSEPTIVSNDGYSEVEPAVFSHSSKSESDENSVDVPGNISQKEPSFSKKYCKKIIDLSDSDEDDKAVSDLVSTSNTQNNQEGHEDEKESSFSKKYSRKIIDSDSEEEDTKKMEEESKRNRSPTVSESEIPKAKRTRLIDSDDSE